MDFNTNSPFLIVTCAPLDLTLDTILLATRLAALEDSHSLLCGSMSLDASITGFCRRSTPPRLDREDKKYSSHFIHLVNSSSSFKITSRITEGKHYLTPSKVN